MIARIEPGAVPEGYTALKEIVERTVAILWGDWAIAELAVGKIKQGASFELDGEILHNADITIIRDGLEIPENIDAANWKCARETIRQLLIDGDVSAKAEHPKSFKEILIPKRYWTGCSVNYQCSIEQGLYYGALDESALEQRTIFVGSAQAEEVFAWLRGYAETFKEKDWNQAQALGWIYTRWPETVRDASPYRTEYHGRTPPRRGGEDMAIHSAFHGLPVSLSYDETKAQLLNALRSGKIEATGIKGMLGERTLIPREFWIDADFFWSDKGGLDYAAIDGFAPDALRWESVFFPSATILALWRPCFPLPDEKPMEGRPAETKTDDDYAPQPVKRKPGPNPGLWKEKLFHIFTNMNAEQLENEQDKMLKKQEGGTGCRTQNIYKWRDRLDREKFRDKKGAPRNVHELGKAIDAAIASALISKKETDR